MAGHEVAPLLPATGPSDQFTSKIPTPTNSCDKTSQLTLRRKKSSTMPQNAGSQHAPTLTRKRTREASSATVTIRSAPTTTYKRTNTAQPTATTDATLPTHTSTKLTTNEASPTAPNVGSDDPLSAPSHHRPPPKPANSCRYPNCTEQKLPNNNQNKSSGTTPMANAERTTLSAN